MSPTEIRAQESEQDESKLIGSGYNYPVWSPDRAFAAAAAMLEALEEDVTPPPAPCRWGGV